MKVSGDKPVFVESVKPGGAARRAGLMPDDMILKVNGTSVRALTHTNVVDLIKASDVVELTVQRGSNRMQRPSPSTNASAIAPMTPVAQRNSITAPQPVDCAKQREMEVHKMNTLQLMLDQVKKNRENLIASNKPHLEVTRADATIQKLEKELQQMRGEPGSYPAFSPSSLSSPPLFPQPQPPNSGTTTTSSNTPAFLSRFPRSLSSLSLGTKKKSIDSKEISSPTAATLFGSPECLSPTEGPFGGGLVGAGSTGSTPTKTKKHSASSAADHHHHHHLHGNHHPHHINRGGGHFGAGGGGKQQQSADIPPPLPQRNNIPKKPEDTVDMMLVGSRRNILVSDLDHQLVLSPPAQDTGSLHSAGSVGSASSKASSGGGGGKSSRGKKKNGGGGSSTHSNSINSNSGSTGNNLNNNNVATTNNLTIDSQIVDANISAGGGMATATSTTELQAEPPPLPPRQPGMLEVVNQNLILNSDNNAGSNTAGTPNGNSGRGPLEMRPPPNSINTLMNYPLITTCTPVRDNMAAAFPLSYRPNIVNQMQQHQQTTVSSRSEDALKRDVIDSVDTQRGAKNYRWSVPPRQNGARKTALNILKHLMYKAMNQSAAAGINQSINKKHRRIVSSPENIGSKDFGMMGDHHHHHGYRHHKTSSDSWEKRSEITPPGTPPPPYLSTSMTGSGGGSPAGGGGHHHQHAPPSHHHHGGHPHHHEHTTAGDLAIASPLSSINNNNNNHHGGANNGTTNAGGNNNINSINNNSGNHMSSSCPWFQSPVGGANAAGAGGPTFATSGNIVAAQGNVAQKPIISMEDDDISDQESFIEENSPFRSLAQLLEAEKSVYLAVFLNFVLTNSDPAALLFYLITMLYKEGSVKDMRKWAYEIHSTFLVPGAPLLCANVDEALARDIDDVLQKENDKAEILRMVFWRSRLKAKETINQQLQQFQTKRTAGLGTMYGPNDQLLLLARGDKVKEQRIIDETLLPKLQQYLDELERESPKEDPKKSALCSALSTVLMRFFVTRYNPGGPIDKVHHFVSREKSFKSRLMTKNRKQTILGHNLHLQPYYEVTRCNHCQNILWGVSPQGYHCTNCELNIHRACAKDLTECCPGPATQKNDSKITKLMEKISSRNHHQDKSRRHDDDATTDDTTISEFVKL
uniref:Phorbol-ester/DAG-type domain-containing protein n=1 Tax=Anopheles dirus TaxID=7168 RepID=A0A182NV58_9DIPT